MLTRSSVLAMSFSLKTLFSKKVFVKEFIYFFNLITFNLRAVDLVVLWLKIFTRHDLIWVYRVIEDLKRTCGEILMLSFRQLFERSYFSICILKICLKKENLFRFLGRRYT